MRFRSSRAGWVDCLPEHWGEPRMRFVADVNPSKSEVSHVHPDTEVSFLPMEAVSEDGVVDLSRTKPISEVSSGYTYFPNRDVLIAKITPCFENGKAAQVDQLVGGLGFGSTEFHVVRARAGLGDGFLLHLVRSAPFRDAGTASMYGAAGQKRVPTDFIADFVVPLPPAQEQARIAAFLDHETAKIDALIAKQMEFLTRLDEHQRAVITHAVTVGLDRSARMKPTGVDGLPSIPSHWQIKRIKHLCSAVVDCLHTTPTYDGLVIYPCIRTADVVVGRILVSQSRLVNEEIYLDRIARLRPRPADVVYSREGERFGIAATIPEGIQLCLGQRMMMFRVKTQHDPNFFMWSLNGQAVLDQVKSRIFGATTPHINISEVINFNIALPPPNPKFPLSNTVNP
jgi:type I restriction enzyme S subunit